MAVLTTDLNPARNDKLYAQHVFLSDFFGVCVWETYWPARRSWRMQRRHQPAPDHSWWGWCRRQAKFLPARTNCPGGSPQKLEETTTKKGKVVHRHAPLCPRATIKEAVRTATLEANELQISSETCLLEAMCQLQYQSLKVTVSSPRNETQCCSSWGHGGSALAQWGQRTVPSCSVSHCA